MIVTSKDSEMFFDLCMEIDRLLTYKIENFRSAFVLAFHICITNFQKLLSICLPKI